MTCKIAHSMQLLLSYSGVLFAVEAIYIIYTTHCPSQPEKPYQDFAASENLINFQFYNLFRDDREQTVHFMLRKDRRYIVRIQCGSTMYTIIDHQRRLQFRKQNRLFCRRRLYTVTSVFRRFTHAQCWSDVFIVVLIFCTN